MAAKTRLGFEGYGVRRAGSFAGKTETAIVIPPVFEDEARWHFDAAYPGARLGNSTIFPPTRRLH